MKFTKYRRSSCNRIFLQIIAKTLNSCFALKKHHGRFHDALNIWTYFICMLFSLKTMCREGRVNEIIMAPTSVLPFAVTICNSMHICPKRIPTKLENL